MLFLSDLDSLARPSLIEYVSIEVLKGFFFWPSFGGSYWERSSRNLEWMENQSSCFLFRGPVISPSYMPLLNLLFLFFVITVSFFGG
jgi:hypothetical protein